MHVSSRKANPNGRGRSKGVRYRVTSIGASASGYGRLPNDTDCVTVHGSADDGVTLDTSTTICVSFSLKDNPEDLDRLIVKLTDLREHQKRLNDLLTTKVT